jgi:hypothetical protein
MSTPADAEEVKLVTSLFSSQEALVDRIIAELERLFGPTDWRSPKLFFDRTRFYEEEMGWPLHRRFVAFRHLVRPEGLVDIKHRTNDLESQYLQEGRRKINIDPGYVSLERLVLATGKNYSHRIYLSRGIYADLTLIFKKGSFRALEWSFRDYADPEVIDFFNALRERYKRQLRGIEDPTSFGAAQ